MLARQRTGPDWLLKGAFRCLEKPLFLQRNYKRDTRHATKNAQGLRAVSGSLPVRQAQPERPAVACLQDRVMLRGQKTLPCSVLAAAYQRQCRPVLHQRLCLERDASSRNAKWAQAPVALSSKAKLSFWHVLCHPEAKYYFLKTWLFCTRNTKLPTLPVVLE